MAHRLFPLVEDMASAFADATVANKPMTFPADITALWAEAMTTLAADVRQLEDAVAAVSHERDQLLAIAQDMEAATAGATAQPVCDGVVIDCAEIFLRERAFRSAPDLGGAA